MKIYNTFAKSKYIEVNICCSFFKKKINSVSVVLYCFESESEVLITLVKTKTYSFWTHNHHNVTGVNKVCIIVSFVTESSYGAYQRTRSYFFSNSYGMQAQIE